MYYHDPCRTFPILFNLLTSTEVAEFARFSELIDCFPTSSTQAGVAEMNSEYELHKSLGRVRFTPLIL
jgi:hypothetical protein